MYFKDENNKPYFGTKENLELKLKITLTIITEEEFKQLVKEINTPTAEEVDKAHNNSVYTAIAELEAKQARPLRELFLDPENQEAKDRILLIDSEIEALRATFK